ncbi:hypothetical protein [Xenorhabdus szentirmaii]|uniref:Uncharacterized protein n=1 Tax=Xenorhabdus szentirmaii DSM 16338 TaxID=1427518 RepID=W1J2C4_9GAMM|nr:MULTISPECIES: hypothetical protein [Xenorhabdus]MBD2822121.1 hypothetical protein [Xenorhabdus sp. 42]PHM32103.1 hypothetical protein Xsze_02833 [Xenorhabdus szentirmaii DSM 16338]PHM41605.1 hypothetical protein Xszus_01298 [Xenorhabdus szentirmaii]CDL84879.1 conserved hypothetical protein [Xenorhabdus szentirmaii DSM 16338]
MSNENDVNKLILDRRDITDDGCDHSASIIDSYHQAARARSRQPYQPKPKLIQVSLPAMASEPIVNIGERINYGRKIVKGIYELSRLGYSANSIAILLRMPLERVQHVLSCNSSMKRAVYKQVMAAPVPTEKEIMKRLAAESKV